MYGKVSMGIQRSTFLIDADGKVAKVWKKVSVDGHDDQVIEALSNWPPNSVLLVSAVTQTLKIERSVSDRSIFRFFDHASACELGSTVRCASQRPARH